MCLVISKYVNALSTLTVINQGAPGVYIRCQPGSYALEYVMLTNPPTILIIEDADIADPMANELRRLGYSVRTNSIRDGVSRRLLALLPMT